MKDSRKTKAQLRSELESLRSQVLDLKALEDRLRKTEESHHALEEKFQQLYDEAPVGYHELDAQGRIVRVNRTELAMLGYLAEEMIDRPVWKFVAEEETTRQVIQAKLAGDISFHETFERTYRRKDGTAFPVLTEDRINRDPEGRITGIRSTLEDITERRRAEEALRQSEEQMRQWQKVEAIGRLAGGVAHDFNNLLMTIKGCGEILLGSFDPRDPRREEVEEIRRAAERATSLTQQLLAFGRRQVLQPQVLDLNAVVANMNRLLRRLIGEDVHLATILYPNLWRVKVDPGQIEQVLMNLAVNARDAMPGGGHLTIETANVLLDEGYARRHVSVKRGPYVMLAVTDTGCGMDKEVQSHLFEPFFTTKEKGKGTGLGLSTAYGIVKQSEGNIWAYSEPGHGTTFKVYLPRVEETARPPQEDLLPFFSKAKGGSETILLAEDEETVRSLICKTLQTQGYTVLEAIHGRQALEIGEQYEGTIHLLVTDVVMPQISGRELAERLNPLRPQMKVLYMSGYPDNSLVHHGVLQQGTSFLQKPFSLHALESKVRELLDLPDQTP